MRARTQIIISLLVTAALITVGTLYLQITADMIRQMPPQSLQWIKKSFSNARQRRQQAVQAGGAELKKRTTQIKQFFKTKKQKHSK